MIILTSGLYLYISIQYNNLFFNTQNQKLIKSEMVNDFPFKWEGIDQYYGEGGN